MKYVEIAAAYCTLVFGAECCGTPLAAVLAQVFT